jgi:hypothetical protein
VDLSGVAQLLEVLGGDLNLIIVEDERRV